MAKDKATFFKSSGGYGFIKTDDHDSGMFFHMGDIEDPDLKEGQEVEFDIGEADRGPRTMNVTRL